MKALSIRPVWAWLLIRPDITDPVARAAALGREIKDIENRSRRTQYRGPFLIHASKSLTRTDYEDAWHTLKRAAGQTAAAQMPALHELVCGGIIGQADLVDCVPHSESPYFVGEFGYVVRNARPLPFRPFPGKLGFFEVPV